MTNVVRKETCAPRLEPALRSQAGVLLLAALALLLTPTRAHADDRQPIRTARLTFVHGEVSIQQPGGSADQNALLNAPLLEGLSVATGNDGQAEIEFEDGSVARITPNTLLALDQMTVGSDGEFQTRLNLKRGLGYFELRAGSKFHYKVASAGNVIEPIENATLRIMIDEPPPTVAVLDGKVHIDHPDGFRADVRAGESLRPDPADSTRYFLSQEIASDSWDNWNEARDQSAADVATRRTIARDRFQGDRGYGWSDLDASGSWYDLPGTGRVWQPPVAIYSSFDPYGYGNWVYYPTYGYVFVSGYPWGWTPYGCGNWSYWNGFGWGWAPNGCGQSFTFITNNTYLFRVTQPPIHYLPPPIPVVGPGGLHPILAVQPVAPPNLPIRLAVHTPTIAGHPLSPLRAIGGGYTPRGGSAIGAPLRTDFPVDQARRPVLGLPSTHPASPILTSGWRPVAPRPVTAIPENGLRPSYPRSGDRPTRAPLPTQGVPTRGPDNVPHPIAVGSTSTAISARPPNRTTDPGAPPGVVLSPRPPVRSPIDERRVDGRDLRETRPIYRPQAPIATQPVQTYRPPPQPAYAPPPSYAPTPRAPVSTPQPQPAPSPRGPQSTPSFSNSTGSNSPTRNTAR